MSNFVYNVCRLFERTYIEVSIKIQIYWKAKPHTQFYGLQLCFHTLLYGPEKHKE
jgi:hypothetical protein